MQMATIRHQIIIRRLAKEAKSTNLIFFPSSSVLFIFCDKVKQTKRESCASLGSGRTDDVKNVV